MDDKDYLIAILTMQRNQAMDALAQTAAALEKSISDRATSDTTTLAKSATMKIS